jgi:hypothetical protein
VEDGIERYPTGHQGKILCPKCLVPAVRAAVFGQHGIN